MIAHNPLHGSGQAEFPHPALALGEDARAAQGTGMTDGRQRQPASNEAPHTIPEDAAVLGELGISRFSREVFPYVHGVSDRAGLWHSSRYRRTRWGLPLSPTASSFRSKSLTRLNTRPARPLSMLRRLPREQLRMTRGRCGSLLHFRMTFPFTTTSPV
jgi:hypothetical protein